MWIVPYLVLAFLFTRLSVLSLLQHILETVSVGTRFVSRSEVSYSQVYKFLSDKASDWLPLVQFVFTFSLLFNSFRTLWVCL